MQIKRIQCPNCKIILDVKNSKNEEVKQITCPSCQALLKVTFDLQQTPKEPMEAHTFNATPKKLSAANGITQLTAGLSGNTQLTMPTEKSNSKVHLLFDDVCYSLVEGQNIIGRKGNTSKATIQIATDDCFMSRQHCSITVTTLPNGNKKVVLSNYQNKNLTTVNGQVVENGDAIRLDDGYRIMMGHTTVTFKLS
jgi:hypothetical protein